MTGPFQSALRMALSIASILSHPCSTMTSGKYVAESVFLETKRGRKLEEESGEGADESVAGYIAGFGKLMCMPWTPTVQSRYDDASSKSVNNDTLQDNVGGLRTCASRGNPRCDKVDAPAFEQRKLLCFDLSESRVLEGTRERIFSDAIAYWHGLKVADATSQLRCASWTRRPDVPSHEEGAR